jgi:serine/threonine protein kinase
MLAKLKKKFQPRFSAKNDIHNEIEAEILPYHNPQCGEIALVTDKVKEMINEMSKDCRGMMSELFDSQYNAKKIVLGEGTYGIVFDYNNDYVAKFSKNGYKNNSYSVIQYNPSERYTEIWDTELAEYIITNLVYEKLHSVSDNLFCMKSYSMCSLGNMGMFKNAIVLSPKFAGTMDLLERIDANSRPLQIEFCLLSIMKTLLDLQSSIKGMHRDLKVSNIFMADANTCTVERNGMLMKFRDMAGANGDGTIIFTTADDGKTELAATKRFFVRDIAFIPKFGDWGMAALFDPLGDGNNVPLSSGLTFPDTTVPSQPNDVYDFLFLCLWIKCYHRHGLEHNIVDSYIRYVTGKNAVGKVQYEIMKTFTYMNSQGNFSLYNIRPEYYNKPDKSLQAFYNSYIRGERI